MTNPMNPDPSLSEGELLPCPFCGEAAERIDIDQGENAGGSCISCTACQASSNVEFEFKENFVSNWNRRALLPAAQPAPTLAVEDRKALERLTTDAVRLEQSSSYAVRFGTPRSDKDLQRSRYNYEFAADLRRLLSLATRPGEVPVGWKPLGDEPKDGSEFIVYRPDAGVFSALWLHPPHEDGGLDWDAEPTLFSCTGEDLTGEREQPTHWMPLPAPPPPAGAQTPPGEPA